MAAADDDPWQAVRQLKPGIELRVYKQGAKDPLAAKFDALGADSLILTTKDGQLSIPKQEIQRIDCRRAGAGLLKRTRAERKVAPKGAEISQNTTPGGTTTVRTGFDLPLKSAFYTVYPPPPPPPAK
jgi:hypothetical protein